MTEYCSQSCVNYSRAVCACHLEMAHRGIIRRSEGAGIFSAESVGSVCGINGQSHICSFHCEGKRTGCSRSVGEVTASERQGLGVAHVCLQACRSALHRELDGRAVCR